MANRIVDAFARMEAQIKDRVAKGITTADKVVESGKALDMDVMEHARYQTLKTLAVARNLLTAEEGQTIYVALGNTVGHFNSQPVHIKSVLTSFWAELLNLEVKSAGGKKRRR